MAGVLLGFFVDLVAITVFAVLIYFRRHAKPSLTVVFTFFNIGLFAVVSVIGRSELTASVGFGLFAMLSIIRLRSDPFSPREIGYFFGALVLGLVNGIGPPDAFTISLNVVVVAAMYLLDHPRLFFVAPSLDVTFDRVISDPDELRRSLEQRLAVRVGEVTVSSVDYVHDLMQLKVQYLPAGQAATGRSWRGTKSTRHDLAPSFGSSPGGAGTLLGTSRDEGSDPNGSDRDDPQGPDRRAPVRHRIDSWLAP